MNVLSLFKTLRDTAQEASLPCPWTFVSPLYTEAADGHTALRSSFLEITLRG
jgi:hypothetical protein